MSFTKIHFGLLLLSALIITKCSLLFKPSLYELENGGFNIHLQSVTSKAFAPAVQENFTLRFRKNVYRRAGLNFVPKVYADMVLNVVILQYEETESDINEKGNYLRTTEITIEVDIIDVLNERTTEVRKETFVSEYSYSSENQIVDGAEIENARTASSDILSKKILNKISRRVPTRESVTEFSDISGY